MFRISDTERNASEQIPKDSQGLFITHDGVIFKGYLFDEKAVFTH